MVGDLSLDIFCFLQTLAADRTAGSESELWPTNLDADYFQDYNCLTDEARLHDFRCPSAGYLPLFSHLSTWWNFPDALHEVQLQDSKLARKKILSFFGPYDIVADEY